MIEVEYKKDLRHNYMVIAENTLQKAEPYCLKLMQQLEIEGLLSLELRCLDNIPLIYYEITSKQSMANILEKSLLTQEKLRKICINIIRTVERAYEYLLPEDDFLLAPEYIYLDINTNEPGLCYLPGYRKGIKDQMNSLLEFLMNKVDYNDKEAVVLVYHLYAVSKEEGYTFGHLLEVLQSKVDSRQNTDRKPDRINHYIKPDTMNHRSSSDQPEGNHKKISNGINDSDVISFKPFYKKENKEDLVDDDVPVMMEKIEGETEISCYPLKTYIYAGVCLFGGVFIIILCFAARIIFNTFGNRIDYSKLFALVLIIFCSEGYLLNKLLDKKNRITKMVKTQEYIDPRQEFGHPVAALERKIKQSIAAAMSRQDNTNKPDETEDTGMTDQNKVQLKPLRSLSAPNSDMRQPDLSETSASEEEEYNPTCILNAAAVKKSEVVLKTRDEVNYKDISITEFPFFIGKLKKNVDYCLEKDVVSRYHAKISREGEAYFITDLNSTNGTFLNQEILQTYQKKEIKSGDEIAFANITYRFIQL